MNKESTTYFKTEGNSNFDSVIEVVTEYLQTDNTIKNVVVFAGKITSVLKLHDALKNYPVTLTVATYPFGREFIKINEETGEPESFILDITTTDAKQQITKQGINYIQGGLPFEPIRSCTGDNSTEMIVSALNIIAKGLVPCVSAAIMAKENGYVEENETILSVAGDTAITVTPSLRRDLFNDDFKIQKILCKPL